jgi:hypothetical protein
MTDLQGRGIRRLVLDLGPCLLMDSTFVGVLALVGMALAQSPPSASPGSTPASPGSIQLLNPRPNVVDLVLSLGIAHLFKIAHADPPDTEGKQAIPTAAGDHARQDITRTSLEAHELLMALHPDNVAKFTDVARFLAEDLRRMESGGTQ